MFNGFSNPFRLKSTPKFRNGNIHSHKPVSTERKLINSTYSALCSLFGSFLLNRTGNYTGFHFILGPEKTKPTSRL